jgi:hypothetical protein
MRTTILCLLLALACAAETSVAPPSIGLIRDCEGRLRPVLGTPGAFLLGPPEAAHAPATDMAALPQGARIEGRILILHTAGGSEKRVPLPEAAARLQRLAPGWLAALPFAIRLTADSATVYRLPMKACAARNAEAAQ